MNNVNQFKTISRLAAFTLIALLLSGTACEMGGNNGGAQSSGGGGGGGGFNLFGGSTSSDREVWTIECNQFEGEKHRETADQLATMLKRVDRINPNRVWVEHDEGSSSVFYGEYKLQFKEAQTDSADHVKGDMVIELSDEIKNDLRFIRELSVGNQFPFFSARPRPKPVPFTGKPEWNLENANGLYTLNVGVTFPTPTLHDFKQAAYLWVEDLRKRGYEAYYYFSPEKSQASICVGTFGPEAFVLDAQGRKGYSPKVKALQQKEEFQFNLENGYKVYNWVTNPDTRKRERVPNYSFLGEIPKRQDITPRPRRF